MQKIIIIYNQSQNIVCSFWKSFFQSIGVWVEFYDVEHLPAKMGEHAKLLYISRQKDIRRFHCRSTGEFYMIVSKTGLEQYRDARNIGIFTWEDVDSFHRILDKLFGHETVLRQLLDVYLHYNMWRNIWILEETPPDIQNESIIKNCRRVVELLEIEKIQSSEKERYHIEYMQLYCEFLARKVHLQSVSERNLQNTDLLRKTDEIAKKYQWTPALYLLKAKICNLNKITITRTLSYLEEIRKAAPCSDILYCIGMQYKYLYRSHKTAYRYFAIAEKYHPYDYRILYENAKVLEQQGHTASAMKVYADILNILPDLEKDAFVSIKISRVPRP